MIKNVRRWVPLTSFYMNIYRHHLSDINNTYKIRYTSVKVFQNHINEWDRVEHLLKTPKEKTDPSAHEVVRGLMDTIGWPAEQCSAHFGRQVFPFSLDSWRYHVLHVLVGQNGMIYCLWLQVVAFCLLIFNSPASNSQHSYLARRKSLIIIWYPIVAPALL